MTQAITAPCLTELQVWYTVQCGVKLPSVEGVIQVSIGKSTFAEVRDNNKGRNLETKVEETERAGRCWASGLTEVQQLDNHQPSQSFTCTAVWKLGSQPETTHNLSLSIILLCS